MIDVISGMESEAPFIPALTAKVDVNLGFGCNLKCPFCYYYDSVVTKANLNTLDTEAAKARLRKAKRLGVEEVEFTGGEPTLRKDFPELVAYGKHDLGFKLISVVTNGSVMSNSRALERMVRAGLDDVLLSVHGHVPEIHDLLTATPGSFRRVLLAMRNISDSGIRLRINSVICKPNYRYTSQIVKFCIDKRVDSISLIGFNPILQVASPMHATELYVRHTDVAEEIKRALDRYKADLPPVNIRYMPFCLFRGYERYVTNHDQFTWEPDEWNNYLSTAMCDGRLRAVKRALLAFRQVKYKRFALKYGIRGVLTAGMQRHYARNKVKSPKCADCAFEGVCDYVWAEYFKIFGDEELQAVSGPRIDNPVWITDAARRRRPGVLPRR